MRILIVLSAITVLAAGCATVDSIPGTQPRVHSSGKGPPAHAPAHGHRRKHTEPDLSFDPAIGVYVVIGMTGHYYDGGSYYRRVGGGWEIGASLEGPWLGAADREIPPGLAKVKPGRSAKGKGKGKPPSHAAVNNR